MPSAKVLKEKQAMVTEYAAKLSAAQAGVICDYQGITVEADTALRREFRKAGVEYVVLKNTLLRRIVKDCGLDALEPHFTGMTSVAFSESDPVAPAKIVAEYAKKSKGTFKVKAGFIEGKVVGESDVHSLAELPSREVLVATVLGTLNAPITGLVTVLNANIRGLAVALQAVADQKSA